MANIALIDLPPDTLGGLAEQHVVRTCKTRWNDGQEDLNFPDTTQLVFINAAYRDTSALALHTVVHQMSRSQVDRGVQCLCLSGTTARCTTFGTWWECQRSWRSAAPCSRLQRVLSPSRPIRQLSMWFSRASATESFTRRSYAPTITPTTHTRVEKSLGTRPTCRRA